MATVLLSASYLSILLAPVLFGWIAQNISISLFPYYLSIMFMVMIIAAVWAGRRKD